MNRLPKISIVTPSYNSENYIEECIQSLMNQDYKNFEHIIIDGGSTDNTLSIIKKYEGSYPMIWESEKDEGMYDAINKGFSKATGDILAWINTDDYYFPWTLKVVAQVFQRKKIQWLTGIPSNTQVFDDTQIRYLLPNLPVVYNQQLIKKGRYDGKLLPFIQQESNFWSRDLWKKAGGKIDCNLKYAGDYYLWKEFSKYEQLYTIHCNLASFRIHTGQKTSEIENYYHEINTKSNQLEKTLINIYAHLYALLHYREKVINMEEIFKS